MPTPTDILSIFKKLNDSVAKKRKTPEIFIHIREEYTPRDFLAQRYCILVTSGKAISPDKIIVSHGDLCGEEKMYHILYKLITQLNVPLDNIIYHGVISTLVEKANV